MIPAGTLSLLWGSAAVLAVALGEPGSCGPAARLDFAELADKYIGKNSFPVGSIVKYVCRPGYQKLPGRNHSSTCLQSQKWSEVQEFCQKRQCGYPGEPENGRLIGSEDLLLGSTVKFICDDGHRLIGQSSRRCVVEDQRVMWTGDIPICQRIPCFPPPDIPHGKHSGIYMDEFSYGTAVTYTCDSGYPLVGNATIYCTTKDRQNGVWSGRVYCGVTSCSSPEIANGKIVAGASDMYAYNQKVVFDCKDGHRLAGSRESHCLADGTWDPPLPICERVYGCASPESQNERIKGSQVLVKLFENVTAECDSGYILKGKHTIQCLSDGTWDSPMPTCVRKDSCGPPVRLDFAELHNEYKEKESFPVGSIVKYTCRPGYVKRPGMEASLTCLRNQVWSEVQEFCKMVHCQSPEIPNGKIVSGASDTYGYNQSVVFDCNDGYRLAGSRESNCQVGGTWDPPLPVCKKVVQCLPPPDIENGTHSSQEVVKFFSGMSVNYMCDPGYALTGEATLYCTDAGTWSSPVPRCKGGSCGPPVRLDFAELLNAYKEKNSFPIGSIVKYTCRPGYVKHPGKKASLTCLRNQVWSEVQEFCKRKSCGHPGEPDNGRLIVSGDFLFGSTVNYSCEEGHVLTGQSSRQCMRFGQGVAWTPALPVCQRISCIPPPEIPHGKHSGIYMDEFSYGTAVTYTCDSGYPLVGNASIYCTTKDGINGVWSGRAYCGVTQCLPPLVKKGRIVSSSSGMYKYKQRVTFECLAGYRLTGSRVSHCQVDGTWDPPPPLCETEYCSSPPHVDHGKYSALESAKYTNGASVKYSCESGYVLIGEGTIYCTASGAWSIPVPHCKAMYCPLPPRILHGKYIEGDFRYGQSIRYKCDTGYSLVGEELVTCILAGSNAVKWSETPKCKVVQCKLPPSIENGAHSNQGTAVFTRGMSVQYTCKPGYTLTGEANLYCSDSGTWSPLPPHCEDVQCQPPPFIQNGGHSSQQAAVFTRGMVVTYACDSGYNLAGEKTIYCTDLGTWSSPAPRCEVVQCQLPPPVQNGAHSNQGTAVFTRGMSVKYACEPGYTLTGEATIYCSDSGTWSPAPPRCAVMHCPWPPMIDHGTYTGEDFRYGQHVVYICDAGYSLVGEPLATCILEGSGSVKWSEPPQCKVTGCVTPEVQNGRVTLSEEEGTIMIQCNPGYFLKGNHTIQCTLDRMWDSPPPTCVRDVQCQPPPFIQNGGHSSQQTAVFTRGMVVTYACDSGYNLAGEKTIYCTDLGTWSSPAPRCEVVQCQLPPPVQNGAHSNQGTAVFTRGMSVKYACEPGYTLTGEAIIYCSDSGTWHPAPPQCEALQCPLPPRIVHGKFVGEDFRYKQSAIYICDAGYSLVGKHNITCILESSNSVKWSEPPKCKGCLAPPKIGNGTHDQKGLEDFPYGSSVTYLCDPGYILIGSATIHCLSSGVWDGPVPKCKHGEFTGCVTPEVQNGKVMLTEEEGTITIQCNPGYFLKGNHTIQCTLDRLWDSPPPTCVRDVQCQPPPFIQNGGHSSQQAAVFTRGMVVTYTCDSGYNLAGEKTIYCTDLGTWSSPAPRCEVVQCQLPPPVQNGAHSNQGTAVFTRGMSVKYACEPGYTLTGEATIYCSDSGTWSPAPPRCVVMQCPLPSRITHGKYIGEDFRYGQSVIYICDAGYSLVGEHSVTCILEGSNSVRWSELPKCKGCLAPPEISNGKNDGKTLEDFPYGSFVTYHCDPGYILTGETTIHCLSSGTWDGLVPQCTRSKFAGCVTPEVQNGRVMLSEKEGTITIQCNPGYILKGNHTIQCTLDGMWDSPPPTCVGGCLRPPMIANGKCGNETMEDFPYGSNVTYHCDPGFFLTGTSTIHCLDSGIWDLPAPQCKSNQSVGCILPQISGVNQTETETVIPVGVNVTLECNDGNTLTGSPQFQCQHDSTWNPPLPACKPEYYVSSSLGLGSLVGVVLLLILFGCISIMVLKRNNVKYNIVNRKIHRNSESEIESPL